jgi:hypothetical protein
MNILKRVNIEANVYKPRVGSRLIPGHDLSLGMEVMLLLNEGSGPSCYSVLQRYGPGAFSGNVAWGASETGSLLTFDGNADYVTVTANDALRAVMDGNYTVIVRARSSSTTTVKRMWGLNNATGGGFHSALFNYSSAGQMRFYDGSSADADSLLFTATGMNDGVWRTFGFSKDDTTIRSWVNGVEDGSRTRVAGTGGANANLFLGATSANPTTQGFEGDIAFFYLYSRSLPEAQMLDLHERPYQMIWQPSGVFYSFRGTAGAVASKPYYYAMSQGLS